MNWLTFIDRVSFDRLGVEFPYHGDTVVWLWPWRRGGKPKFISVGFTGTGEWGDVRSKPSIFARIWCALFGHDGPTVDCGRSSDRVCLSCGRIYIPKR